MVRQPRETRNPGRATMNLTLVITSANLIALLLIYGKLTIMGYQHKLMWTDFSIRKDINGGSSPKKRGASVGSD
jgi:hypothetical protein